MMTHKKNGDELNKSFLLLLFFWSMLLPRRLLVWLNILEIVESTNKIRYSRLKIIISQQVTITSVMVSGTDSRA